jgi:rare lipoprotein A
MQVNATAYSVRGETAAGGPPHQGVVAADPAVLPLGSRIRIHGAGTYSGKYVVRDTGRRIHGRKIDIYMPRHAQAKRFGRRTVTVEVLSHGPGSPTARARHHSCRRCVRRRHRHRQAL